MLSAMEYCSRVWGQVGSRSVHLETANSLDRSSFINALSRFINQRGTVGS